MEFVGLSPAVRELKSKIEKMAEASVSTVLVTGESGTGKELFARYAHRLIREQRSPRFSPFIKLNCAALPETLLESELFGYEKGSFTDAKSDKKGLFELAEGGSILLDEIGDLKQSLQGKLLRVLEERMVRPVGGAEEIPIDTTVIATTNVDLAEAVAKGAFRKDLFYRLNTFNLHVPPLRERKDDILLLTAYYLSHYAQRFKQKTVKRFSREAEDFIKSYSWPGNIRELRNVVERLVVLESEEDIEPRHLPNWLIGQTDSGGQSPDGKFILPEKGISLDELEKDLIQQALERSKNNKAQAAKLLHISYDSLRYQVKKLGME
jgi:transcriptional regulator with PAS, ATPase and Fis domain